MNRPITTLFLLMSVDGKISTGSTDNMDVDKDFPMIPGIAQGLHQYYEIEQTTDLWSFNSGRVLSKVGINQATNPVKTPVSFAIIDNHHLTKDGVQYLAASHDKIVIFTTNPNHIGFSIHMENVFIIKQPKLDLNIALFLLRNRFQCEEITIQTGGTLNSIFLREKLLDYLNIVVAPALIGGANTSTLIDGESLTSKSDLSKLGVLKLQNCKILKNSYLQLKYRVIG